MYIFHGGPLKAISAISAILSTLSSIHFSRKSQDKGRESVKFALNYCQPAEKRRQTLSRILFPLISHSAEQSYNGEDCVELMPCLCPHSINIPLTPRYDLKYVTCHCM
jgi:hypothetical protein